MALKVAKKGLYMTRKVTRFILVVMTTFAFVVALLTCWFFKSKDIHVVFDVQGIEDTKAKIYWDNSLNLEQTFNACGPYATMAYAFSVAQTKIDPEKINAHIGGRHGDGLTFPWGISSYLNDKGINAHIYFLGLLSRQQKADWLRNKVNNGYPVIEMIGTSEWAHYVTVLGVKGNTLQLYDSSVSGDQNGFDIGNSNADIDYIIDFSETVSFHGLRTHLAISY